MWFLHNEWAIMSVGRWEPSAVSEHLSLSAVCSSLPLIHRKVTLSLLDPRRDWADSSVLQSTPSENRAGRVRGEGGTYHNWPISAVTWKFISSFQTCISVCYSFTSSAPPPSPSAPPSLLMSSSQFLSVISASHCWDCFFSSHFILIIFISLRRCLLFP